MFTGGTLGKLRRMGGDLVDILIRPRDGLPSYSFDGLSSGQKEIITTLFSIWYQTQDQPAVVLIDEPELHLNAEWHRRVVNALLSLAPHNQYIFATHSVGVMESVKKEHRFLILDSN